SSLPGPVDPSKTPVVRTRKNTAFMGISLSGEAVTSSPSANAPRLPPCSSGYLHLRQDLLETLDTLRRDFSFADGQGAQFSHADEMLQTRIGDNGAIEVQAVEIDQSFQIFQTLVGYRGAVQPQARKTCRALEVDQSRIGKLGAAQSEFLKLGKALQV